VFTRSDTTDDTRGRLFENIVIHRFIAHGVHNFPLSLLTSPTNNDSNDDTCSIGGGETVYVPSKHQYFYSQHLPSLRANNDDGIYIPINCNFPAIDVVWKSGNYIFGVQIHTSSSHRDVASMFEKKCQNAGWFDHFSGNVFLIYLCPDVKSMIKKKQKKTYSGLVKIGYITIAEVECLKNMQL
jgi:hypothetical protein